MPSILNSDDGVVSGTSGLKSTGGNDGLLNIQTNGSNAISISAGQRSTFPTTIGVGGATPSTSGSGISFPATQSASSDANTLDDYEEGTWTPTISGSSTTGTTTYTSQTGTYTKIGNLVEIRASVTWSAATGTGQILMGGLPFTSANVGGYGFQISSVLFNGPTWSGSPAVGVNGNSTNIGTRYITSGGADATSIGLSGTGTYEINGVYLI